MEVSWGFKCCVMLSLGNRKSLLSKHYSNNCCRKSQWRILKLMGKRLRQQRIFLQCRRPGLDPWVRKSPGEGNGNSLQYSCLEYPMDGGAWQATVHGVAKSWTQLSNWAHRDTFLLKSKDLPDTNLNCPWMHAQLPQSCPTLCDPMDHGPTVSSVHGILQARILEWGAIFSSWGVFPTQGSNLCLLWLLQWWQMLYH